MKKYKQNLVVIGDKVYSYDTHVADINHEKSEVISYKYYSQTTTKHINFVASVLKYNHVKNY